MTQHTDLGDSGASQPPVGRSDTVAARSAGGGRHRRARRRRWLLLVAALGLLVVGGIAWFLFEAYPLGSTGPDAVFYVSSGESMTQVANTMAGDGVISSTLAFRIDLAVTGTPSVQPGWYAIPTSSSFSAVRAALGNGPNALGVSADTAESSHEIALKIANAEGPAFATTFESLVRNGSVASPFQPHPGASLEGLLSPGIYVLVPKESPRTLLEQMTSRFVQRAASVGLLPTTTLHGLDAYQLITVASIVEKEGYLARNMPKTATVVFNRLRRGTPLQMDATVEYALGQDGGPVTHATESVQSPYNTYLHVGLTPTPICIPSTEALGATLHAPSGPWLYFTLVDRAGDLAFATTFAEQLANEALAARRGL